MKKSGDNEFSPEIRRFRYLSYLFSLLGSSDQRQPFERLYDFHAMKCYMKFTIRALIFFGVAIGIYRGFATLNWFSRHGGG